mgnify:CR=1 FL=1
MQRKTVLAEPPPMLLRTFTCTQSTADTADGFEVRVGGTLVGADVAGKKVLLVDDVISAHEAEMRAVGIMGASPAYELRVADLVIRDMEEMRLANIRKIFSDVEFDPVPELELLLEPRVLPCQVDIQAAHAYSRTSRMLSATAIQRSYADAF